MWFLANVAYKTAAHHTKLISNGNFPIFLEGSCYFQLNWSW